MRKLFLLLFLSFTFILFGCQKSNINFRYVKDESLTATTISAVFYKSSQSTAKEGKTLEVLIEYSSHVNFSSIALVFTYPKGELAYKKSEVCISNPNVDGSSRTSPNDNKMEILTVNIMSPAGKTTNSFKKGKGDLAVVRFTYKSNKTFNITFSLGSVNAKDSSGISKGIEYFIGNDSIVISGKPRT